MGFETLKFTKLKLPYNILKLNLVLVLILTHFISNINAQYLRDKSKFLNVDSFYPKNDDIYLYYKNYKIYPIITQNIFGIPEIEVKIGKREFPLYFDFGNKDNICITTELTDKIKYTIIDTGKTYNPDGSFRDKIFKIIIPYLKVFNNKYVNEKGVLANWKTFSTEPFNGLIGLKYLDGKSFTLNYQQKELLVSSESILENIDSNNAEIINLNTYKYHPFGIHFEGKINNEKVIIYFDTGKSQTTLNRDLFPQNKIKSDKSGSFYKGTAELFFNKLEVKIEYPRVKTIHRNLKSDLKIGAEVGIDLLKYFILSIDRTKDKNQLIIHK